MIEAFEIGVSIALSDDLSSGLTRAQQEIERLQKTSAAHRLTLEAIRSTATKAMSVAGLSQPSARTDRPGITAAMDARARPAAFTVKEGLPLIKADRKDDQKPENAVLDAFPQSEFPGHAKGGNRRVEPAQQINFSNSPVPLAESVPSKAASVETLREQTNPSHVAPVSGLAPSNSGATLAQTAPGVSATAEMPNEARSYSGLGLIPASVDQPPQSGIAHANSAGVNEPAVAKCGQSQRTISENTTTSYLMSFADPTPEIVAEPQKGVMPQQGQAAALLAGGPVGVRTGTTDPGVDSAPFYPGSGDLRLRMANAPVAMQRRDRDGDADTDLGQGQPQGDVFLDGVLIGRWISRFLRGESERSNNGPNGFNPRRSQILPGVTLG